MPLPKWMTVDVRELFFGGKIRKVELLFEDFRAQHQKEIDLLHELQSKAKQSRPRYVEMKVFQSDDIEAARALAKIAESDVFKYFVETLRQDVYYEGIIKQADERQMMNAAMKLKGIELLVNQLNKWGKSLDDEELAVEDAA